MDQLKVLSSVNEKIILLQNEMFWGYTGISLCVCLSVYKILLIL